nr:MAG TPA: hypothetical protein [Crassvirales sp.]
MQSVYNKNTTNYERRIYIMGVLQRRYSYKHY